MAEKQLTESAWKSFAKGRKLDDAKMLRALADLARADARPPDERIECLDAVSRQAQALLGSKKGDKDLAAQLSELEKALARARKAAEQDAKAAKLASAQSSARSGAKAGNDDDEGDDDDASSALLTTKMLPLVRQLVAGRAQHHVMIAAVGKRIAVSMSAKPITPPRRKLLADHLQATSGIKYYTGHCLLEGNAATFVLDAQVAGLAKGVKAALLAQTGLRVNKVSCRGIDGGTDEDEDLQERPVGGGQPEDVRLAAVPAGPALAELSKARAEWAQARSHALAELGRLKQVLQTEYRDAADAQAALASALERIDATIATIDDELGDRLDQLLQVEPAARAEATAAAKAALTRVDKLVSSDAILQSIDGNELAPEMVVAGPLRAKLNQVAASLPSG